MSLHTVSLLVLCFAIGGCGGSSPTEVPSGSYRVIDLDKGITFPTVPHYPMGISSDGSVVGSGGPINHAFRYRFGRLTDLGLLSGAAFSGGLAVNSSGVVVGYSYFYQPSEVTHACKWANGILTDLNPPGSPSSWANGINDSGLIVGAAQWGAESHATLWLAGGQPVDLGTINNAPGGSRAYSVSRSGSIVGSSSYGGRLYTHPFILQNGVMADLEPSDQAGSEAFSVNDSGHVVGYRTLGTAQRATLWMNGASVDLGVLPVDVGTLTLWSWARSINNNNQIVGSTGLPGIGGMRAFIWKGGTLIDLNTLLSPTSGYLINDATGINDEGLIIGQASRNDGSSHGVLLVPQ